MAQIKKNLFLQGASGMLGKQLVYKTVDGKMIVSTRPTRNGEISEAQKRQNLRFKYASVYAKNAIEDEVLGPIYAEANLRLKRYRSAYQLAMTDYLRAPEIGDMIILSGTSGSSVFVEAFEDPQLENVQLSILAEDDSVVDSGEGVKTSNGIQWEFILPTDIPEGGKLEVKAYDLPGNMTAKIFEVDLSKTSNEPQT